MNSIIDDVLSKYIISVSHLNEQNIFMESQSEEFLKRLYDNSLDYPAIIFSENSDYYAEHNQDDVDLENEIRASVLIDIEIVCNNIDDIIHFENLFSNQLSSNYFLKEVDSDSKIIKTFVLVRIALLQTNSRIQQHK